MLELTAKDFHQLVEVIGTQAGLREEGELGPIVVDIRIWDNRTVTARYYAGQQSDAETGSNFFFAADRSRLMPLVRSLCEIGQSFITKVGQGDRTCSLQWQIDGANDREPDSDLPPAA